ncbi:MAG: extracellular solute-binding protein, partial [Nitriliruptorales bacterium]|nr:extracellular solute-binding protein [Nitriliruptorales bacterium]
MNIAPPVWSREEQAREEAMTARARGLVVLLVLGLVVAACGAEPPTAGDDAAEAEADDAAAADGAAATGWDDVYSAVEDLEGEERTDRLIDLAQEAGGVVRFYSTMNGEEGFALIDAFTEATGVDVEFYRASARNVTQRVVQEYEAGFENSADVISANGTDMVVLDGEGVLAEFNSPAHDEYPELALESDGRWVWTYVNYYTPVWNTELVSADEAPDTWMEALTNFGDGRCVLEAKSYDWLASLIPYLQEEEGLSEDEAIDLVRTAASGCVGAVSGNSLVTNLVASGEYDIVLGSYHISARHRQADGAPVEWFDPPATIFGRANGVGVN